MQQNETPMFSASGEGGIALLGWSLGNSPTLAAISYFDSLPSDAQSRLGPQMRALIMQGCLPFKCSCVESACTNDDNLSEPPSVAIGADSPPQIWSPQIDTSIPEDIRLPMFTQWITSYFHHGDLSTRNTSVLSYVLPATFHAPSIFNMTSSQMSSIVEEWQNNAIDSPFQTNFKRQNAASYVRACYDPATKVLWPNMKIWEVVGDATCSFPLTGLFSLQNDNDARGGGFINFNIIRNANHFVSVSSDPFPSHIETYIFSQMHWDEPDRAIEAYLKALA